MVYKDGVDHMYIGIHLLYEIGCTLTNSFLVWNWLHIDKIYAANCSEEPIERCTITSSEYASELSRPQSTDGVVYWRMHASFCLDELRNYTNLMCSVNFTKASEFIFKMNNIFTHVNGHGASFSLFGVVCTATRFPCIGHR